MLSSRTHRQAKVERVSETEGCCEHQVLSEAAVIALALAQKCGADGSHRPVGRALCSQCPGMRAVGAGSPGAPAERRGAGEASSLLLFFGLSVVCSPSWEVEAEASMGEGGGNAF